MGLNIAQLYDPLDPDRSDLDAYLAIADEFGARRLLDIGCGTGTLAILAAERGLEVTGVDPDGASLDVARRKPGAKRVRWIHGDARMVPPLEVDLVTMTANVAQAIVEPDDWRATLDGAFAALREGGHLVFETRDPAREAWRSWTRDKSHRVTEVEGVGPVETWFDLVDVRLPLVTFRSTNVLHADGTTLLVAESTLRFRGRAEVEADLAAAGFAVADVRDAPDRPGRELVFVARRTIRPWPSGR
ncbi:MAG TPA: class I SAM-dependent methyltransferase [Gaiellaceae bacterium]|nr:class I SAM-dependent methyltransferase [Gaiellaceae bacterium]